MVQLCAQYLAFFCAMFFVAKYIPNVIAYNRLCFFSLWTFFYVGYIKVVVSKTVYNAFRQTARHDQLNAALFDIHGFRLSDPPVNNSAFRRFGIAVLILFGILAYSAAGMAGGVLELHPSGRQMVKCGPAGLGPIV